MKMSNNVTLDLGLITVETAPAEAYAGHAGRVYASEGQALADLATNQLAEIWLDHGHVGWPSFKQIMEYVESNPELFEASAKLARFNGSQIKF
jgi:hypothetical protein